MKIKLVLLATVGSLALLTAAVTAPGAASAASPVATSSPALVSRHAAALPSAARAATRGALAQQLAAQRRMPAPATPAHLDPALDQLAGVTGATRQADLPLSGTGQVQVSVRGAGAAQAVAAVGGRLLASFAGTVTASVLPAKLRLLAARPGVSRVAPVVRARTQATSEGVLASGAQNWADYRDTSHSGGLGNGGQGVKIAIVDAGFRNLQSEVAAGNFDDPAGNPITVVYDRANADPSLNPDHCSDDNATDHGTAVAEVAHQMAPRATLYLYCVEDSTGFAQSASQVVAAGVKIASSSLGFIAESAGDDTGVSETAVQNARNAGVLWIQSAGNGAQLHWSGLLADATGDGYVDLLNSTADGEADVVDLDPHTASQPASSASIVLSWNQWPTSDLPIQLAVQEYNSQGTAVGQPILAKHLDGDDPTVEIDIANYSTTAEDFHQYEIYVLIDSPAPSVHYDLTYGGDVYPSYLSGVNPARAAADSVTEPATSAKALAVGAASWRTDQLETFSSRGPTITGLVKPDLLGFDGVSSNLTDIEASDGSNVGFFGTSAAAPHVAGAAALVLAEHPELTADGLQSFLQGRASPKASPSTNQAGAGLLQLVDLSTAGCSARASLPARVTIDRPDVTFAAAITTNCTNYHAVAALQGPSVASTLYWTADHPSDVAHFNPRVAAPGAYVTKFVSGVADAGGISWTSASTTLKYSTQDYTASSRKGAAVYINGLLKNYSSSAAGLVRGGGRTVYLQRYIGGGWQNMLSRVTLADGTMTVGFIQNKVFQYRLLTPESATIWGGNSVSTFR